VQDRVFCSRNNSEGVFAGVKILDRALAGFCLTITKWFKLEVVEWKKVGEEIEFFQRTWIKDFKRNFPP
jgi:hypothetical protein